MTFDELNVRLVTLQVVIFI